LAGASNCSAARKIARWRARRRPFGFALHVIRARSRYLPLKTRVVIDWLAEHLPPLLATD